jgi:hypothetical protein
MKKLKLLCKSGFEDSLKSSTATGLKSLSSADDTVLNIGRMHGKIK